MVFDGACLTELATSDTKLLDEEVGPSKKCLQKSNVFLKDKKDVNHLMHVS
jgi:hypothetical protein